MGDWAAFFAAELGAAAALAGLVIVAISINISRILAEPNLPGRAAETLIYPTGVLIACSFALVPHQPAWVLGGEMVATGTVMGLAPGAVLLGVWRSGNEIARRFILGRALRAALSSLPFIVSGVMLCLEMPEALYWLVPGVIVSLVATVLNSWILLVEILR